MKGSGDCTHVCQSITSLASDSDWTLATRTQTSEQEYRDLTASNTWLQAINTILIQHTPKFFMRNPVLFSWDWQNFVDIFGILPKLYRKFDWEWKVCRQYYSQDENHTEYPLVLVQQFHGIFQKSTYQLAYTFPGKLKGNMPQKLLHSSATLLVHRDDHPS